MKISKVGKVRFYRDYNKGALIKSNKKLDSVELLKHIKVRLDESQHSFKLMFSIVKSKPKKRFVHKEQAKQFSEIIKNFLIEEYAVSQKISIDNINHLNNNFINKKINENIVDDLELFYSNKIKEFLFYHKDKYIRFDFNKTNEINAFFKDLLKKYDKNFMFSTVGVSAEKIYQQSIINNKIAFSDDKLNFMKKQISCFLLNTDDEDSAKKQVVGNKGVSVKNDTEVKNKSILQDIYQKVQLLVKGKTDEQGQINNGVVLNNSGNCLKSCIEKKWDIEAWYKSLNFSKNQYLGLTKDLSDIEKYEVSIIFQSLKEVIIDLKPKKFKDNKIIETKKQQKNEAWVWKVKMYSGYEKIENVDINKILNLIINKTMGKIKNQFTSNIIAFGKQIYINEKICKDKNIKHLTGLHYEIQKAYDEIRLRNITALSFATNTVNQLFNKENSFSDLMYMQKSVDFKELSEIEANLKTIFAFDEVFDCFKDNGALNKDLVKQIIKSLYKLRNNDFHFNNANTNSNLTENANDEICLLSNLINKELQQYASLYIEKITSTQLLKFYKQDDIINFFKEILPKSTLKVAYMPSLKNINRHFSFSNKHNENKNYKKDFKEEKSIQDAQLFLLSEIYSKFFAVHFKNKAFNSKTINKVEEYYKNTNEVSAGDRVFKSVKELVDFKETMSEIAGELLTKYTMDNINTGQDKKSEHYKIILNHLVAVEFENFLSDKKFKFVKNPNKNLEDYNGESLAEVKEKLNESQSLDYNVNKNFYILARLVPNSVANNLLNAYSKFSQYINDISTRFQALGIDNYSKDEILKQLNYSEVEIKKIMDSLAYAIEFNCYSIPVKKSKEKYYDFLSPFFEEIKTQKFDDLFVQGDKQPVVYKSIMSLSKAFIYEKFKSIFKSESLKITTTDLDKYLNFDEGASNEIQEIQNKISENKQEVEKEEWEKLNSYNALKNHVLLQNMNTYSQIFIEMQSMLIGYAYKWERDIMYFFLAISALSDEKSPYSFDFNVEKLFIYGAEVYGKTNFNSKVKKHLESIENLNNLYAQLFNESYQAIKPTRNKIAHFDAFKSSGRDKISIFNLFVEVYENFRWDRKLQNSTFKKFINILDKFGVDISKKVINFKQVKKENKGKENKPNVNIVLDCAKGNRYIELKKVKLKIGKNKYLEAKNKHESFGYTMLTLLNN